MAIATNRRFQKHHVLFVDVFWIWIWRARAFDFGAGPVQREVRERRAEREHRHPVGRVEVVVDLEPRYLGSVDAEELRGVVQFRAQSHAPKGGESVLIKHVWHENENEEREVRKDKDRTRTACRKARAEAPLT